MNFTNKTIPHIFRNKYLRETGSFKSSGSIVVNNNGSGNSTTIIAGEYLPATRNEDGTYTVDVSSVKFQGNVVASGEVIAHKEGSSLSGDGSYVTVIDSLTSDSTTDALSAAQGKILNEKIESITVGDNYYTKDEINDKLSSVEVDLSYYYNKSETYSKEEIDQKIGEGGGNVDLTDYYKKSEVYNINETYNKEEIDKLIGSSGGGSGSDTDLSNYYTKEEVYNKAEVDQKIDNIVTEGGEINLQNYYTKSEVDQKIEDIEISGQTSPSFEIRTTTGKWYKLLKITVGGVCRIKFTGNGNVEEYIITCSVYPEIGIVKIGNTSHIRRFGIHNLPWAEAGYLYFNTLEEDPIPGTASFLEDFTVTFEEYSDGMSIYYGEEAPEDIATEINDLVIYKDYRITTSLVGGIFSDHYYYYDDKYGIKRDLIKEHESLDDIVRWEIRELPERYYSKSQIDSMLEDIVIGDINLDSYYTKNEVDQKIEDVEISNSTNYYSKEEINDLVDNITASGKLITTSISSPSKTGSYRILNIDSTKYYNFDIKISFKSTTGDHIHIFSIKKLEQSISTQYNSLIGFHYSNIDNPNEVKLRSFNEDDTKLILYIKLGANSLDSDHDISIEVRGDGNFQIDRNELPSLNIISTIDLPFIYRDYNDQSYNHIYSGNLASTNYNLINSSNNQVPLVVDSLDGSSSQALSVTQGKLLSDRIDQLSSGSGNNVVSFSASSGRNYKIFSISPGGTINFTIQSSSASGDSCTYSISYIVSVGLKIQKLGGYTYNDIGIGNLLYKRNSETGMYDICIQSKSSNTINFTSSGFSYVTYDTPSYITSSSGYTTYSDDKYCDIDIPNGIKASTFVYTKTDGTRQDLIKYIEALEQRIAALESKL